MLLSPFLNIVLEKIDKEFLIKSLVIATVIWSIVYSFTKASYGFTEIIMFCILYLYAGYVRLYVKNNETSKQNFVIAILSMLIVIVSSVAMLHIGYKFKINKFITSSAHFSALQSPFVLLSAIELLIGFSKKKEYSNKIINRTASCTLGVYLIHDNKYVRPFIWKQIFKLPNSVYSSNLMFLYGIGISLLVFVICVIIDFVRQSTIEKVVIKLLNKHIDKLYALFDRFISYLSSIFKKLIK